MKPIKAWAVIRAKGITADSIYCTRPEADYSVKYEKAFTGRTVRVVRVEIREVKRERRAEKGGAK